MRFGELFKATFDVFNEQLKLTPAKDDIDAIVDQKEIPHQRRRIWNEALGRYLRNVTGRREDIAQNVALHLWNKFIPGSDTNQVQDPAAEAPKMAAGKEADEVVEKVCALGSSSRHVLLLMPTAPGSTFVCALCGEELNLREAPKKKQPE
jgi:hypothetical protein